MEKNIKIILRSRRIEIGDKMMQSLFESVMLQGAQAAVAANLIDEDIIFRSEQDNGVDEDNVEMITDGILRMEDGRVEVSYEETELTGMEGSTSCVSFAVDNPGLVSMMRGGTVSTALVFEPHRRHICAYQTPYMPFEICVYTTHVDNRLLDLGTLDLDYLIEVRGAQAEHTHFNMTIRTVEDDAAPLERPEVMLKGESLA